MASGSGEGECGYRGRRGSETGVGLGKEEKKQGEGEETEEGEDGRGQLAGSQSGARGDLAMLLEALSRTEAAVLCRAPLKSVYLYEQE